MKAAVFKAVGEPLAIEEVSDPTPAAGEMIISVGACGVCGTDLHWTENRDSDGGWRPLRPGGVLGHEFAGEVVALGLGADSTFKVGDSVCALPFIGCGRCRACMVGRVYRCEQAITRASPSLHGAYAQFTRVGCAESVRLPAGVDHKTGALVEPLAVGLAAVERARFEPGASVLVIGSGPVGLAVTLWARFLGARNVVVSDMVASRAERAIDFGATHIIDASREDVAGRMKQMTGGAPQVVFECVGVPGTLQSAVDYVDADGCVVVVGLCMGSDTFKPAIAITKALDLRFTICYDKHHFETVVHHLASGRVDASKFVTDTVGFDTFSDRFESLKCAGHDLKVLLEPAQS